LPVGFLLVHRQRPLLGTVGRVRVALMPSREEQTVSCREERLGAPQAATGTAKITGSSLVMARYPAAP